MKLPFITRKRYEREMAMLHSAYSVSTTDLREQLKSLIQKFSMVVDHRNLMSSDIEVLVKMRVPKTGFYDSYMSPADKEAFWWHVGQRVSEELKKQIRAASLMRDSA